MSTTRSNQHRIDPFLRETLLIYARVLGLRHPCERIRNASVIETGLPEFERLGLAVLLKGRADVRSMTPRVIKAVTGRNGRPFWKATDKLLEVGPGVFSFVRAEIEDGTISWKRGRMIAEADNPYSRVYLLRYLQSIDAAPRENS